MNCSKSEKPQCCGDDGLIKDRMWDKGETKCDLQQLNPSAQVQSAFAQKVITEEFAGLAWSLKC